MSLCIQTAVLTEPTNIFDSIMDISPTSITDKLHRYLAADVEDMKDGLMWWYERRMSFPHLSHMACDYLSIPGEQVVSFHLSDALKALIL